MCTQTDRLANMTHTHFYTDTQADTPTHTHGILHTYTKAHTGYADIEQQAICDGCEELLKALCGAHKTGEGEAKAIAF